MKIKKYVIAAAIFGGMLFLAQTVNTFNVDAEQTAKIERSKLKKLPTAG